MFTTLVLRQLLLVIIAAEHYLPGIDSVQLSNKYLLCG